MPESSTATPLYQDCPHCDGKGFLMVDVAEGSPLHEYLDGDTNTIKVCPHCVRRSVVPAVPAPTAPARLRARPKVKVEVLTSDDSD